MSSRFNYAFGILALALSGCGPAAGVLVPLGQTLGNQPPAYYSQPRPSNQQAQQGQDLDDYNAETRRQLLSNEQMYGRYSGTPQEQAPVYDPTFPVSGGLSTFGQPMRAPQQQPPALDPTFPVSGGLSTFEPQ